MELTIFSPAKINLYLAVTGRRADGFHDLLSVVGQLGLGDVLTVESGPPRTFTLTCDDPQVPVDGSNLVLQAARAFVAATGWEGGAAFRLIKHIPVGAGLGGGSSNAVAALRALNRLASEELDAPSLAVLAAQLGSDCTLFLHDGPVVMQGRGERVEPLGPAAARLAGRKVLVFKPGFGINTGSAYRRMAAEAPRWYLPPPAARAQLAAWLDSPTAPAEQLLFNSMEGPAFVKFCALPALLDRLVERFGLVPRMSGSGSACFALLADSAPVADITACIHDAWGPAAWVVETRLRG